MILIKIGSQWANIYIFRILFDYLISSVAQKLADLAQIEVTVVVQLLYPPPQFHPSEKIFFAYKFSYTRIRVRETALRLRGG